MDKSEITIHRALVELKTLDQRIQRKTNSIECVGIKKNGVIFNSPDNIENEAKSSVQSVEAFNSKAHCCKICNY